MLRDSLINALKVVGKNMEDLRVVICGVGAAGVACAKIIMAAGVRDLIGVDIHGIVHRDREQTDTSNGWFAENTNPEGRYGDLAAGVTGADLFVGVSAPGVLKVEHLNLMAEDPIVFAMANPEPEIHPEIAMGKVRIMATGRSDYPNQINNVLCFPGIFRGALDIRAREIDEPMKLAAAEAMAAAIPEEELVEDYIIPSVFDERVAPAVAEAVSEAGKKSGAARRIGQQSEVSMIGPQAF
jgi:malate dehydrogenase (oxaloacetate-decarboxylating)